MGSTLSVTIRGQRGKNSHTLYKTAALELPVAAGGKEKACHAREKETRCETHTCCCNHSNLSLTGTPSPSWDICFADDEVACCS